MRLSKYFIPTLKEAPSDAEIISHKLMVRAGLIRKLSAGIYNYLPICFRIIKKIENIVRTEMEKAGAIELLLPILSPAELWQESGRWNVYGKELMRMKDRHNRDFALGPTHEEIITDLVRNEIKSYKELPICLFQIQTKFRDEIRPRFGVMRAREFIMKDAYSFHTDEKSLDEYYDIMFQTYSNIFKRCGLRFRAVLADSGAIGGKTTHEFMVLADSGESLVLSCPDNNCGYAATVETAEGIIEEIEEEEEKLQIEKVFTPEKKTVDEVSEFFNVKSYKLVKTILYKSNEQIFAVLIRGDREINEAKLRQALDVDIIEMTDNETTKKITRAEVGFAGPIGLPDNVKIIADKSIMKLQNFICGANVTNYHYKNVNLSDLKIDKFFDLAIIKKGDKCIKCGKILEEYRGIEVGQIFKLGTKYSKALKCLFAAPDGKLKEMVMGCYGIGITRIIAAAIEQNNDEDGIIWPIEIAPFQIIVIPLNKENTDEFNVGEKIYQELLANNYEVLFDDRNVSPGFKFKDADLIGIPIKIIIGKKNLQENCVEIALRKEKIKHKIEISALVTEIKKIINNLKNA
ncbi:MAG TPA: proline--tRNA ligase [bacterium]|nr:proline--tRNA ligase [bacterium]HOL47032.1 proline--tRNA ligase [bacterium]HPQ18466.1 proline--tRNA ligase [bacterium]